MENNLTIITQIDKEPIPEMEVTEEVMTIEIITITIIIEMTAEITRIKIEDKITMRIETPEMIAEMIEEEIIITITERIIITKPEEVLEEGDKEDNNDNSIEEI